MKRYWMEEIPPLREPALIAAFAGWNDAAESATTAVQVLIQEWSAKRFAGIDPEEFYVFTETRPRVRIVGASHRQIDWPANEFHHLRTPDSPRDYVVLVGIEPQLRWKSFTGAILGVVKELDVKLLVTLGGLLADVPHTRPPRLTGSATDSALQRRLRGLHVGGSRYEGPTGILGVLGTAAREQGLASASVWGNVPHYISTSSNPRVSLAMLRQLGRLLDLELDLAELAGQADSFDAQVSEIVSRNSEVAEYVRQLEQREGGPSEEGSPPTPPVELPSSDLLIKELEEFLKRRPTDGEEGDAK